MNSGPYLILGVAITCVSAWMGLIFTPYVENLPARPVLPMQGDLAYPAPIVGLPELGREVYISNGCAYCHTQKVRPQGVGADMERGWGIRPTLAEDYAFEPVPQVGVARNGPDLANVALRRGDEIWHYQHLFAPRSVSPGSIMPSFAHLFEYRKVTGEVPEDVLKTRNADGEIVPWDFRGVPASLKPKRGQVVVPTQEAKALVAYLMSLDRSTPLAPIDPSEIAPTPTPAAEPAAN